MQICSCFLGWQIFPCKTDLLKLYAFINIAECTLTQIYPISLVFVWSLKCIYNTVHSTNYSENIIYMWGSTHANYKPQIMYCKRMAEMHVLSEHVLLKNLNFRMTFCRDWFLKVHVTAGLIWLQIQGNAITTKSTYGWSVLLPL